MITGFKQQQHFYEAFRKIFFITVPKQHSAFSETEQRYILIHTKSLKKTLTNHDHHFLYKCVSSLEHRKETLFIKTK